MVAKNSFLQAEPTTKVPSARKNASAMIISVMAKLVHEQTDRHKDVTTELGCGIVCVKAADVFCTTLQKMTQKSNQKET